jgi:hypothetical protein
MGRFVGHLGDEAASAALAEMGDSTLLQVAFVLESNDSLDDLVGILGPERLGGVIQAAGRENLWIEILGLLGNMGEQRRLALAGDPAVQGDGVLEAIVRTATEQDLLLELLPLVPALPAQGRQRVAQEVAKLDPARREAIAVQARAAGLGEELGLVEADLGSHLG